VATTPLVMHDARSRSAAGPIGMKKEQTDKYRGFRRIRRSSILSWFGAKAQ
jgi:hypothetical protein